MKATYLHAIACKWTITHSIDACHSKEEIISIGTRPGSSRLDALMSSSGNFRVQFLRYTGIFQGLYFEKEQFNPQVFIDLDNFTVLFSGSE